MSAWDWGHKVAPLSKGMVLTARFGTWLEIGARAIGQCGGLSSGRELAWWQCRDRDRLDLRAGGHRAAAELCKFFVRSSAVYLPCGG